MLGVIGKLGVLGLLILGVIFAIFLVTANLTKEVPEDEAGITPEEAAEIAKKIDKKEALERLEKFLDGDRSEETLKGNVGVSTDGGQAEDLAKKVEDSASEEAVDLQKFLEEQADTFEKEVDTLADGETDLNQEVMWRIIGNWVYFRISFSPYDQQTHELMQGSDESIFMSFVDKGGERVVPASAPARIPMRNLYLRKSKDSVVGWAFNGKLSLGETDPTLVERSHVGWIFSNDLARHLKRLKRERSASAERTRTKVSSP